MSDISLTGKDVVGSELAHIECASAPVLVDSSTSTPADVRSTLMSLP
jgi:hypothetical protein